MSQGLMVYLVPEQEINGIIGSRDSVLLEDVKEAMAQDLDDLEDYFDTEDEDYGPSLTFRQALRELINGEYSHPHDCYHVYAYAFETVLRYLGDWLGNSSFSPCKSEWFCRLDHHLGVAQAGIKFEDLVYRSPVKLPGVFEGAPCIGYWSRSEIVSAAPVVAKMLPNVTDRDERESLEQMYEWLKKACDDPGTIIIGFFY